MGKSKYGSRNWKPQDLQGKIHLGGAYSNVLLKLAEDKPESSILKDSKKSSIKPMPGKVPARCSKARNSMNNGRPENMGAGADWMTSGNLQACESKKARAVKITQNIVWNQNNRKGHDMFPVTAQDADLDIEEGQIVSQEQTTTHPLEREHAFDHTEPADSLRKRVFDSHNASNGNQVAEGYDKQRILQTMARMEQRGERFKKPITLKKEPDKLFTPEVDPTFETADEKQPRPARKRRWGGRFSKNDSLMLGIPLKARF